MIMLLEFKVQNYKAFKNEVNFSMIPAPKQKGLDYSIFEQKVGSKKINAISSSVIYGPNASGKTTIIGAMDTMRSIVLRGHILNAEDSSPNEASHHLELIPNNQLKDRQPVKFFISFFDKGYQIDYSFTMDVGFFLEAEYERRILEERLDVNGINVFLRNEDLVLNYSKKISELFLQNTKASQQLLNVAKDSINPTELFLMNGFKLIISRQLSDLVSKWFKDKFMVIYKANAMELIRRFDDSKSNSVFVEKTTNQAAKMFGLNSNAIGYVVSNDDSEAKLCSILENASTKQKVAIKADIYESYGTLRFVNIFPLVLKAIYTGGTLVIDEFDASIHPMALMSIINIFHDDEINTKQAQLIFDTHNPIFLNSNLFRRDEIKFVERNSDNYTSDLYALSDFGTSGDKGVRKNEDYMKNYFVSQYGAISDIDFSPLFKEGENDA